MCEQGLISEPLLSWSLRAEMQRGQSLAERNNLKIPGSNYETLPQLPRQDLQCNNSLTSRGWVLWLWTCVMDLQRSTSLSGTEKKVADFHCDVAKVDNGNGGHGYAVTGAVRL